jgi:hypothetical protein
LSALSIISASSPDDKGYGAKAGLVECVLDEPLNGVLVFDDENDRQQLFHTEVPLNP